MNGSRQRIELGSIERYFAAHPAGDVVYAISSLWVLDKPLVLDRLRNSLSELRRRYPVFFSAIDQERGTPALVCDDALPIDRFLTVYDGLEDTPREFFRRCLLHPLDIFKDTVFRLHYASTPQPMLGFQTSHVVADAFTMDAFKRALAEAYARPAQSLADVTPQTDWPGYRCSADWLRRSLKLRPSDLQWHAARDMGLSVPLPQPPVVPLNHEVGVVHRSITAAEFGAIFQRCLGLGVSTLHYLAACMAVALDRTWDEWNRGGSDFFAINLPVDFRRQMGIPNQWGNVVYPLGIPYRKCDLVDIPTAARHTARSVKEGLDNLSYYVQFFINLSQAERNLAAHHSLKPHASAIFWKDQRLHLTPLAFPGATEVASGSLVEQLGDSGIVQVYHQSPVAVRRSFRGQSFVYFSIRRHPLMEEPLRRFLQVFFNSYLRGDPTPDNSIGWEFI